MNAREQFNGTIFDNRHWLLSLNLQFCKCVNARQRCSEGSAPTALVRRTRVA